MYSTYKGGFYGDYYSEAVMCGTMSDMKRGTRKYVLEYVHTWYIVRSWNYIYVALLGRVCLRRDTIVFSLIELLIIYL